MSETITLITQAQQGDRTATERLVTENTGLIWSIARRYFGRGVEPDDLFQLGCVGFLKAVEGFDTAYGTQFSTYAVPKIAGEIRRFLRDDGAVKVSRSIKERAAAIKKTRERLTGDFGREPTVSELSEAMGLSPEEIASAETATSAAESIQRQTGEEGFSLEDVLCTDGMEEKLLETHRPAGGAAASGREGTARHPAALLPQPDAAARGGAHRRLAGPGQPDRKESARTASNIFLISTNPVRCGRISIVY